VADVLIPLVPGVVQPDGAFLEQASYEWQLLPTGAQLPVGNAGTIRIVRLLEGELLNAQTGHTLTTGATLLMLPEQETGTLAALAPSAVQLIEFVVR
jgi:hypothetical protein